MGRLLYAFLLRLHPRHFRERFGEEMMSIFDDEMRNGSRAGGLLLDGAISLFRQWALRPNLPERALSSIGPGQQPDIPVFHTFDSRPPRRSALVNGAILSFLCFGLVSLAMRNGGGHFPRLLIGAKYPRPHVLPVDRSSIAEAEPDTQIKVKAPAIDPLYPLADVYFKIVRVLDVLDADRDRIISAWEIMTAASPLRRLDRDGDGKLSAEECGLSFWDDPKLNPDSQPARLEFMRANPVLAALDADGNGEISAGEIENGSVALRSLDKNHDGSLTPAEVLPGVIDRRASMILSRLDTDRDRKLSRQERTTADAEPLRDLLDRADRNGDGVITAAELTNELQLRDELKRQIDEATRSGRPKESHASGARK